MAAAAPSANASGDESCPSVRSPGSATNSDPRLDRRESVETDAPRRRRRSSDPVDGARDLGQPPRPHAASPSALELLAGDGAVVERRSDGPPSSWSGSWPLPAITTTSPGRASRRRERGSRRGGRARRRSAAALGAPALDLRDDGERVLRARVVARDDREVGVRGRRRPHQGTLRAVAVATATEHDDDPARRHGRAAREHCSDAIRRVRVIHHHQEVLARRRRARCVRARRPGRRCPRIASSSSMPSSRGGGERREAVRTLKRPRRASS